MRSLIFTCPKTGAPIDAGVETDHTTLAGIGWVQMKIRCPHCNDRHDMRIKDGQLDRVAA